MFCGKCGAEIKEGASFCSSWGYQRKVEQNIPTKSNKSSKKGFALNLFLLVVAVTALGVMVLALLGIVPSIKPTGASDKNKIEGKGFKSAEDAVSAYIEALNDGDIDEAVSTFAIESYVDNFDTKASLERFQCFSPTAARYSVYEYSDGSEFDRDFRNRARQAVIVSSLYNMISARTARNDSQTIGPFADEDAVDDFMDEMKKNDFLAGWKEMKFVKFIDPADVAESFNSETAKKSIKDMVKPYRCEEVQEICALVEIDGDDYYQFAQCGMYDGKWYIISPYGYLSSYMGVTAEMYGLAKCSDL